MIKQAKNVFSRLAIKYSKKTNLNLLYFFEHGFWVSFRYFFVGLFTFLITVGFTHLGTKELFGQYQYILSVIAIFSIFSLPGLNMVALKEVAKNNTGSVCQSVVESFRWSWLASPFIIGYGIYSLLQGQPNLGMPLILAGIIFPFYYAPNTWYVFFEGRSLFKPVTSRMVIQSLLTSAAILFGLYLKLNLLWLVLIFLGFNSVFNWVYYWEIANKCKRLKEPLDMKYGLACTLQKFAFSLTGSLPPIIISFLYEFETVAVYQIAYLTITQISSFLTTLSATYLPLLFKYEKLRHKKIIFLNLFAGSAIFFLFVIFIKIFFLPIFGVQYTESYKIALIFSILILVLPLRVYLINFFTAHNNNRLIIISYTLANILGPILFYLTKNFGFKISIAIYFYTTNLFFLLPMALSYFFQNLKKDSKTTEEATKKIL